MIRPELLEILVCPETKQPVSMATDDLLGRLNERIRNVALKNRAGKEIREELGGALVRQDGEFAYPIREDLPVMLVEEAIPLSGI